VPLLGLTRPPASASDRESGASASRRPASPGARAAAAPCGGSVEASRPDWRRSGPGPAEEWPGSTSGSFPGRRAGGVRCLVLDEAGPDAMGVAPVT